MVCMASFLARLFRAIVGGRTANQVDTAQGLASSLLAEFRLADRDVVLCLDDSCELRVFIEGEESSTSREIREFLLFFANTPAAHALFSAKRFAALSYPFTSWTEMHGARGKHGRLKKSMLEWHCRGFG